MARATRSQIKGPGITPRVRPVLPGMEGDFSHWKRTNVRPQKQPGYAVVAVTIPLGDLTGGQMRLLADLALAYG